MDDSWAPARELTAGETKLLLLCKKQKLWSFLRSSRHLILDEEVRDWLAQMYAEKCRGVPRVAPERLLLAMLLQVGFDVADHEVPTLTAVDRRWQMVLDLGPAESAAFSQGTVFHFRERLREFGVMRKILNKTVQIARETGGFDHKRLRALMDSSPLLGAGRVEDTFNLIGRAIVDLLGSSAEASGRTAEEIIEEASLLPLTAGSIKAVIDVDWTKVEARSLALNLLIEQFQSLLRWLRSTQEDSTLATPPLSDKIRLVEDLIEQDTEPDPAPPDAKDEGSRRRIKEGGKDRVISISDREMRHGRKSKKKVFAGYKRHVAVDADVSGLIVAVHVDPGNRTEYDGAAPLLEQMEDNGFDVVELHFDRGYLSAPAIHQRRVQGMAIVSKPHRAARNTKYFPKAAFDIDFQLGTVTCPNEQSTPLRGVVEGKPRARFSVHACRSCPLNPSCVSPNRGRGINFHPYEALHREMADELKTSEGRARRRERIPVEHALARVGAIQGRRARFRGVEKNQFDLERTAVVANLFAIARLAG